MNKLVFKDIAGNEIQNNKNQSIIFRPAVYVFVENEKNQLLMIVDASSNKWEIPGGGVEIGETLNETGIRELLEETGYKILIEENSFYNDFELLYSRSKKTFRHQINFYYKGKLKNDIRQKQNFAEGENILKVEFIDKNKILDLDILLSQKKVIEKYLNE